MAAGRVDMGKSRQNISGQFNARGYPIVKQMARSRCVRDEEDSGSLFQLPVQRTMHRSMARFACQLLEKIGFFVAETHPGKTPLKQYYLLTRHLRAYH